VPIKTTAPQQILSIEVVGSNGIIHLSSGYDDILVVGDVIDLGGDRDSFDETDIPRAYKVDLFVSCFAWYGSGGGVFGRIGQLYVAVVALNFPRLIREEVGPEVSETCDFALVSLRARGL